MLLRSRCRSAVAGIALLMVWFLEMVCVCCSYFSGVVDHIVLSEGLIMTTVAGVLDQSTIADGVEVGPSKSFGFLPAMSPTT